MERRPVPPLRTDLEFKPIDKDRLGEILGGFSCRNTEGCRIQNCYTDREHLISSNPAAGAEPLSELEEIEKHQEYMIINGICRWKHVRINATWTRSEPQSDADILRRLDENVPVQLNKREKEIVKRKRKELKNGS